MALDTPYPFWVFSPGNALDAIIKMVCQMNSLVAQIVLFMVPSALAHLHLKASQSKQSLP
jgi:phenylacetate-CoA ligase